MRSLFVMVILVSLISAGVAEDTREVLKFKMTGRWSAPRGVYMVQPAEGGRPKEAPTSPLNYVEYKPDGTYITSDGGGGTWDVAVPRMLLLDPNTSKARHYSLMLVGNELIRTGPYLPGGKVMGSWLYTFYETKEVGTGPRGSAPKANSAADLKSCEENLRSLAAACEAWSADHGGLYPKALSELKPRYLKRIPSCPTARTDTYSGSYSSSGPGPEGVHFWMNCQGHYHTSAGVQANLPGYDSSTGLKTGR